MSVDEWVYEISDFKLLQWLITSEIFNESGWFIIFCVHLNLEADFIDHLWLKRVLGEVLFLHKFRCFMHQVSQYVIW